jgi:hypothetical protein
MSEDIKISLTHDEALVLFEFFARFQESDQFALRHNSEFIAFSHIAGQIEETLVEPFKSDYLELLQKAQKRLADDYEGLAPGVNNGGNT